VSAGASGMDGAHVGPGGSSNSSMWSRVVPRVEERLRMDCAQGLGSSLLGRDLHPLFLGVGHAISLALSQTLLEIEGNLEKERGRVE
jgi:hypothetical protein